MSKTRNSSESYDYIEVKKRSIARELTISLFVLVIIVESFLLTFIYLKQAQLLLQELETKADDYADYLSEILAVPIWDYDDEQIDKIGAGVSQNDFVAELSILSPEHQYLYKYQSENSSKTRIKRSITINHKGKPVGFAELHLSLDIYKTKLEWFRNSTVSVLVTSLIVILITTGFLLRYFIRNPITMLQKGLDRVAKGDYTYKFHDIHHKELSGIATRIKEMATLIKKRELTLHNMNKELKQEISIRKKEATEKLRLEKKLQLSNKMEAIGLLAGSVAHDLNNVLSGIVSYPDLILMDLPEDSPLRKHVLTMQSSGQKAAEIVQDLLTLARRGVVNKSILNLNDIALDYLKSPEYEKLTTYHSNISVVTNLNKYLLNIEGSSTQLIKLIMNLLSNAAEAQPTGGEITISTHNQYVDTPIKGYEIIEEGDFVVLEVKDNGLGIAAEDLTRIFEPFYTKKIMGRSGTGLGMAVIWGTVHDHNGYIDIKSIEGIGTTFSLFFPAKRDKNITLKNVIPVEEYIGKKETILVVDDVEEQRGIAANILSKLNYNVSTVSSGEDGVEYMKNNSVDLLVLDMIMEPGIDGLETYRRIVKLNPKQKAIIASGYSENNRVKETQKLGAGEYIKKPYTLETIGIAVKKELEK